MPRLLELYTSIQGEGPRTGEPTQFVRFAGCNLRCPGWPCDTQHAIEPSLYRTNSRILTPQGIAEAIQPWPMNLCLTGGEPFIQKHTDLQELVQLVKAQGYTVEVFTNGTIEIPQWAFTDCQIMLDWKLPGSGEDLVMNSYRYENLGYLRRGSGVKFIVVDHFDLEAAYNTWLAYNEITEAQFWVGAAWGRISDEAIINFVLENRLPWRLNVQMHKHIWPADKQGV